MATVDKISGSKVRMEIEVTPEQFEHGLNHAFEAVKGDVEVKGFRKGKVPRHIFEQKFGVESLYEEAINHVLQETYAGAVTEHEVEVVAQPKIDLDITKIERGKAFSYIAEVAVKPDITLGEYKGLKMAQPKEEVTDEDIQAELEKLREQNAELVLKEEGVLEDGDIAIFDFEGFVDGEAFEGGKAENYELKIGSGQFIPGFEEQMKGMKVGEERDINVQFPEDYHAENLKGKDAIFKVKLHEMKVRELPELNDEFVKDLDKEGIETLDALKEDLKKQLLETLQTNNKNAMIDFVVTEATNNATYELPQEMIEDEKNRLMDNVKQQASQYNLDLDTYLQYSGVSKEDFEKNLLKDAERSLAYNLVIEAIGKKEEISATEEEREAKYQEIADQYKMSVEQVRAAINDYAVDNEIIYRKTIDFLVDNLEFE
jgi:trigger factor